MATITRRGNSYRIRVSCGLDVNGKQIFQSMTYTPTHKEGTRAYQKEIDDAARDFERKAKEGKFLSGERLTYKAIAERWQSDWAGKKLSDGGADYMKIIKRYAYPAFGNVPISKIKPLHVQALINDMSKRGLKAATVRRAVVAINSVFRYAYRMSIIYDNPCDRCELPSLRKESKAQKELHFFTEDQARTFLEKALTMEYVDTIKGHSRTASTGTAYQVREYTEIHTVPNQFRALYALSIYAGLRRGEVAALTWRDIDLKKKTVSVNKAAALRKGGYIIKETKTQNGNRIIPLPKYCISLLKAWKLEQMQLRYSLGTAWEGPEDFEDNNIFIQATGKMIDLDTIGKKFHSVLDRYNETVSDPDEKLPEIRLHDLRHTFVTILIAAGVDIEVISYLAGHSSPSVTWNIYGHPHPRNINRAAEVMENAIRINA